MNEEIHPKTETHDLNRHLGMIHPDEMVKPVARPKGGRPSLGKPTMQIRVLMETAAKLQIRARSRGVPVWRIVETKDY